MCGDTQYKTRQEGPQKRFVAKSRIMNILPKWDTEIWVLIQDLPYRPVWDSE